jgi:hypothetical protein
MGCINARDVHIETTLGNRMHTIGFLHNVRKLIIEQVRQELAHALYQHDAACRVIARLIKERDAAKGYVYSIETKVNSYFLI